MKMNNVIAVPVLLHRRQIVVQAHKNLYKMQYAEIKF